MGCAGSTAAKVEGEFGSVHSASSDYLCNNLVHIVFPPLCDRVTIVSRVSKNTKKIQKPKPWKHPQTITPTQLKQMRDEFWDTAPHYGGQKGESVNSKTKPNQFVIYVTEIWDALRAAAEADLNLAQVIVDSAGIINSNADLTVCYDERGAKYELPKYVLSDPTNLIREN
ncbi:hypothetical protein ZIOFF_066929 [Zingiber officinale]|uniref:DC-UbP/UBTD2 N-terminal domain-containing protein n=1 Tax=Zingiber officinale TaxID=94328 RepID=A0A8J5C5N6_ZINOF|nr:hypothetical protein ZIOFF_066929 [Zingiber officinale]